MLIASCVRTEGLLVLGYESADAGAEGGFAAGMLAFNAVFTHARAPMSFGGSEGSTGGVAVFSWAGIRRAGMQGLLDAAAGKRWSYGLTAASTQHSFRFQNLPEVTPVDCWDCCAQALTAIGKTW
jgi:hypothetical protein